MKLQRPVLHIVLSLILLLSQQVGWAHVISHIGGLTQANQLKLEIGQAQPKIEQSLEQTLAQSWACEQCLAFAQLSSALPLDLPAPVKASAPQLAPFDLSSVTPCRLAAPPYSARAPPIFS